jgi:predicted nucleotidyltransferase
MTAMGSPAHQVLIRQVTSHYEADPRVRAIVVFGSVATGAWHELSDVDLDVVTGDDVTIDPVAEARELFGSGAVIVIAHGDSADVVLDSLAELSIRWHPLAGTSPNITGSLRAVAGPLGVEEVTAAGEANRRAPGTRRLLDILVREAVGAWKADRRGNRWDCVVAVERARRALTELRGHRDGLRLDPADPLRALAAVLAEASATFDLGPGLRSLLRRMDMG